MSLSKPVNSEYGDDALAHAAEAVHRGVGLRRAAAMYGVPKSTLHDKVKLHTKGKRGPKPAIPDELEDPIETWIINMARIGYGQTKEQIKNKVQELVNAMKIPTPWDNNRPSEKWYRLFMNRHPNLRYRMCQALAHEQCGVSFNDISKWFDEL